MPCTHLVLTPKAHFLFRSTVSRFWDTGNFETHVANDPVLPWTLQGQRHLMPFLRYKVVDNRKCTTVKGAVRTLSVRTFCFPLRPAVFQIQGSQNRKYIEWPQHDLKHLTVKSILYTLNAYLRPKFWSILLYGQPLSSYKVVKNRKNGKFIEWPQSNYQKLNAYTS